MKMTTPKLSKRSKIKYQTQSGFTLIELLIVISIVGVIAVWGVPQFGRYAAQKKVDNAIAQIVGSIKLARSQAMTTGREVNLCGLNAARTACSVNAGSVDDWSLGWGIVVQGGAGDDAVLQVYEAPEVLDIAAVNIAIKANGMRAGNADIDITVHPTNIEDVSLDKVVTINAASLSYKIN